ncbi:MAG: DNA replication/repair protein RecF, partial [Desulfuromonadales bacterium]|nr:DNA replication/repair protein RecF [Desulfuromonadales bacterium]
KENINFFINLNVENNITKNDLKIYFDNKNTRKVLINNKKPDSNYLYKIINTIIYYPAEINYLNLYPIFRRNLIDRSIFLIDNDYLNDIKLYNKILQNRNLYLKENKNYFDPWIDQHIKYSEKIIKKRILFIERINDVFSSLLKDKKVSEKYELKYKKYDIETIKEYLYKKFKVLEKKEKIKGFTLFGPHVDNFIFCIDGQNISDISSEGQKKYFLLFYKYSQYLDYIKYNDDYPILLFDDYSSELDSKRKNSFFDNLFNENCQIFLTTTDLPKNIKVCANLYEVKNGQFNII